MASGFVDWASSRAISPREVIRPLKPISWAMSSRIDGEPGVVLDDQEDPVARLEVVAVAADVHLRRAPARRRAPASPPVPGSRSPRRLPPGPALARRGAGDGGPAGR